MSWRRFTTLLGNLGPGALLPRIMANRPEDLSPDEVERHLAAIGL